MNQLDESYQELVTDILKNGYTKEDRTGTGTLSVFGRTVRYNMRDGFPLLTTKKMYLKGIIVELLWFLRGDTNIKYLIENDCNIWNGDAHKKYKFESTLLSDSNWGKSVKLDDGNYILTPYNKEEFVSKIINDDEFAIRWGDLGPIYGKQWRCVGDKKIDQLKNVIDLLHNDPDSRRMLVSAWNVKDLNEMTLPPCHHSFQLYTRTLKDSEIADLDISNYRKTPKRAISLKWTQRSVDVGLGLPYNIASYSILLMLLAKHVNMMPDELIGELGDTHIYKNHIDALKTQCDRNPYKLPYLKIVDRDVSDLSEYTIEDFKLYDYEYHPSIKMDLSN